MKRFIRNCIVFFLPIILLMSVSEVLLRKIPKDYKTKRAYLDTHSSSIQVLFLGSSHTMSAINPEWIQKKSYNVAFPSQTYDLDLQILRHYESDWGKLECIAIPVSYCSLFEKLSQSEEYWRIKNYVLYLDLDISNRIKDHSEILGNKLWYSLYRMYHYYVLGESELTSNSLGWRENKTVKKDELDAIGITKAKQHTVMDQGIYTESFLRSIIGYAQNRGIRVILYTTPAYRSYTENLDPKQWTKTLAAIEGIQRDYAGVSYYNFLFDPDFEWDDFADSDHLSVKGSQKFTQKIDSLLNDQVVK